MGFRGVWEVDGLFSPFEHHQQLQLHLSELVGWSCGGTILDIYIAAECGAAQCSSLQHSLVFGGMVLSVRATITLCSFLLFMSSLYQRAES